MPSYPNAYPNVLKPNTSSAPGMVVVATLVSFGNEWYNGNDSLPNLRIPIAGGIFALFTAALEQVNPTAAKGLATIMLITVLFTPLNGHSPAGTLASLAIANPKRGKQHGNPKH